MTRILFYALAGSGVVVLVLWGCVVTQQRDAALYREGVIQAAHAQTLVALADLEADRARTVKALETVTAAQKARADALHTLVLEIDHAPETDDAPVAPVLRHALDGLRR